MLIQLLFSFSGVSVELSSFQPISLGKCHQDLIGDSVQGIHRCCCSPKNGCGGNCKCCKNGTACTSSCGCAGNCDHTQKLHDDTAAKLHPPAALKEPPPPAPGIDMEESSDPVTDMVSPPAGIDMNPATDPGIDMDKVTDPATNIVSTQYRKRKRASGPCGCKFLKCSGKCRCVGSKHLCTIACGCGGSCFHNERENYVRGHQKVPDCHNFDQIEEWDAEKVRARKMRLMFKCSSDINPIPPGELEYCLETMPDQAPTIQDAKKAMAQAEDRIDAAVPPLD